jgi:drug/metabolite transporter (DMT)-like permease
MMMWRFLPSIILVSLEVVALTHSFSTPPLLSTSISISTRTHTRTIAAHSHTRIEKNWNGQHISQRIGRRGALFSTDTEIEIEIEQTEKQIEMDSNVNINGNPGADADADMQTSSDINIKQKQATSEKLLGILVLLTVPLSWGTYAPVVKYVYEMDPPVPGFVFSAGYYLIASVTLTLLAVGMSWKNEVEVEVGNISTTDVNDKGADADADADTNNIVGTMKTMQETEPSTSFLSLSLQTRAGIELGSYLFLGNCLQVVGLKTVPADRAAFLVQLTTVMVPLFSAIFAGDLGAIPAATWVACVLAFAGVLVMGLDRPDLDLASLFQGADVDGSGSGSGVEFQGVDLQGLAFSQGDVLITLAAVSYTMHVIRLGRYAKHTKPLNLAASKATVEAVLSIGLVAGLMTSGASTSGVDFVREMSGEIQSYFLQLQNAFDSTGSVSPPDGSSAALWACLWTGWVTCAYTIYAQSFGQSRVNPTDANLIYTMQPIFSSLFAYFLLGESLGVFGFGGASLIFFALWVVTSSNQSSDESEE